MNLEEYRLTYSADSAPGWDAINAKLGSIYGAQEPQHWGTLISHRLGGPDPLDGISAYLSQAGGREYLHYCSYGFSALYYDEESVGRTFSGYGFELTFRIPPAQAADPMWVCVLLQKLARYVFQTEKWFEADQWIDLQGPINADPATTITGFALTLDPELQSIETPHGHVDFLQVFGITSAELAALKNKSMSCGELLEQHRRENPLLITDLVRGA